MKPKTIIYCTDGSVTDKTMLKRCQEILRKATEGMPIICVSQQPCDFGDKNIVVGDIGRSWLSLFKQQDAGIAAAETPVIAFAEHDMLYCREHFEFDPPDLETFWYNTNLWLGQWSDTNHPEYKGMYSFWPGRTGQSQLIVGRDIALQAYSEREKLIETGGLSRAVPAEPGHQKDATIRKLEKLHKLVSTQGDHRMFYKYLLDWTRKWTGKYFVTKLPNVDIRHGNNFSRGKRGTKRRYELAPWGKLADVLT